MISARVTVEKRTYSLLLDVQKKKKKQIFSCPRSRESFSLIPTNCLTPLGCMCVFVCIIRRRVFHLSFQRFMYEQPSIHPLDCLISIETTSEWKVQMKLLQTSQQVYKTMFVNASYMFMRICFVFIIPDRSDKPMAIQQRNA